MCGPYFVLCVLLHNVCPLYSIDLRGALVPKKHCDVVIRTGRRYPTIYSKEGSKIFGYESLLNLSSTMRKNWPLTIYYIPVHILLGENSRLRSHRYTKCRTILLKRNFRCLIPLKYTRVCLSTRDFNRRWIIKNTI